MPISIFSFMAYCLLIVSGMILSVFSVISFMAQDLTSGFLFLGAAVVIFGYVGIDVWSRLERPIEETFDF